MVIDYKKSGVDVEAGDSLVEWLQDNSPLSDYQRQLQKNVVSGIGGFASLFQLNHKKYQDPLLITCTDGVGTKVKLASHFQDYSTVGQDLVAMCVNDLVCCGGEPLLFLDYFATGKLQFEQAKPFLRSVQEACRDSDCLLVGGETAEMPGVYQANDFDCAGFAIGMVEKSEVWGPQRVKVGDVLVGVSSSGFHSNGFSLVRKLFEKDLDQYKKELLMPTNLYVKLTKALREAKIDVHAAAHVTGGGVENLPRVIQSTQKIKLRKWEFPALFKEAQKRSGLDDLAMLKTFNCGVGFCIYVQPEDVAVVEKVIRAQGFESSIVGEVHDRRSHDVLRVEEHWLEP